jgi:carboxypeptidase Taq
VQLWESLRVRIPDIEQQIARGEFGGLFGWLREHVHGLGAKVGVNELMKDATDQPLSANALLRYLESKYLQEAS